MRSTKTQNQKKRTKYSLATIEHNRPNKSEIDNDEEDEVEDNNVPSPTACREDENNSNRQNQATTTPKDVLSNDKEARR